MAYHSINRFTPQKNDTHVAKNYRPIALFNIMYKLYTSCINSFLSDHLLRSNIITLNKLVGNKKYGEQQNNPLLINQSLIMLENVAGT